MSLFIVGMVTSLLGTLEFLVDLHDLSNSLIQRFAVLSYSVNKICYVVVLVTRPHGQTRLEDRLYPVNETISERSRGSMDKLFVPKPKR